MYIHTHTTYTQYTHTIYTQYTTTLIMQLLLHNIIMITINTSEIRDVVFEDVVFDNNSVYLIL